MKAAVLQDSPQFLQRHGRAAAVGESASQVPCRPMLQVPLNNCIMDEHGKRLPLTTCQYGNRAKAAPDARLQMHYNGLLHVLSQILHLVHTTAACGVVVLESLPE